MRSQTRGTSEDFIGEFIRQKKEQDRNKNVFSIFSGIQNSSSKRIRQHLTSDWEANYENAISSSRRAGKFRTGNGRTSLIGLQFGEKYGAYRNRTLSYLDQYIQNPTLFKNTKILIVLNSSNNRIVYTDYEEILEGIRFVRGKGSVVYIVSFVENYTEWETEQANRMAKEGGGKFCQVSSSTEAINCIFDSRQAKEEFTWDPEKKGCYNSQGEKGWNELQAPEVYRDSKNMDCVHIKNMDFKNSSDSLYPITQSSLKGAKIEQSNLSGLTMNNPRPLIGVEFISNTIRYTTFNQGISNSTFKDNEIEDSSFKGLLEDNVFEKGNILNGLTLYKVSGNTFNSSLTSQITIDVADMDSSYKENIIDIEGTLTGWNFIDSKLEKYGPCKLKLKVSNTSLVRFEFKGINICKLHMENGGIYQTYFTDVKASYVTLKDFLLKANTSLKNVTFNERVNFQNVEFHDVIFRNVLFDANKSEFKNVSFYGGEFEKFVMNGMFFDYPLSLQGLNFYQNGSGNNSPADITIRRAMLNDSNFGKIPYDLKIIDTEIANTTFSENNGAKRNLDLTRANCQDCEILGRTFDSIKLKSAVWNSFPGSDLVVKSLAIEDSILQNSIFTDLQAESLTIRNSDLRKSNFTGSDSLKNSTLTNNRFDNATLEGVSLKGSNLTQTNFNRANLKNVIFSETTTFNENGFREADLYGVNFNNLNVIRVDFGKAKNLLKGTGDALFTKLNGVNFKETELFGGFVNAKIKNSSFENARLNNATISGALENVKFIGASMNSSTLGGEIPITIQNSNLNSLFFLGSSAIKNATILNTNLGYASFNDMPIENVTIRDCDFFGAIFSNTFIKSANFENNKFDSNGFWGSQISETTFKGETFNQVDFTDLNIFKATFDEISFKEVTNFGRITGPNGSASELTFSNVYFIEGDLEGLKLTNSTFYNADFTKSSWKNSNLQYVTFDFSVLKEVDFSRAQFKNTTFKTTMIENSELSGAMFASFEFIGSRLSGSKGANKATWSTLNSPSSFYGSQLEGMDFSNTQLININFQSTSLVFTSFRGANLSSSNFKNAKVSLTNFIDANTNNANFEGVDPEGVIGLAL